MTFILYLSIVLFILVSLVMVLLILVQKGRGGGLSSAFGGTGANTAFGAKTGDVLTWATSVVFGIFLFLAVVLNLMADRREQQRRIPPGGTAPVNTVPAQPGGGGGVPLNLP
jgi:preprotein translocase subunit SecG